MPKKKYDNTSHKVVYYGMILLAVIGVGGQLNWTGTGCGGERKGAYYYRYAQQDKPGQSYIPNPYAADFAWNKSFDGFIMPLAPNYEKKCPAGAPRCYYVVSEYGARGSGRHMGIDIAGSRNDQIVAPKNGTVTGIMIDHRTCGNGIEIDHNRKMFTRYCHLTTIVVSKGQDVIQGQVLGTMGNTGTSFPGDKGIHLHLETKIYLSDRKRISVNPRILLPLDFPQSGHSILSRIKPLTEHLAVNKYWFTETEYAAARMLASETDNKEKEVLILYAAVNRFRLWNAFLKGKNMAQVSMKDILTCAGSPEAVSNKTVCKDWGDQRKGRPYHTVKEGNLRQLLLAKAVLMGKLVDPTAKYGRATYWFEPFAMSSVAATANTHSRWCKDNKYFIPSSFLQFDDHQIRFYGEKRFLTPAGQAKLVQVSSDACLRAPPAGFDRQSDFVHSQVQ